MKGEDAQIAALTKVVKSANADVLVLAGIDYDLHGLALAAFVDGIGSYPYRLALPSNRGRPSGLDLDGDGRIGGPDDAQGYGAFQGQGSLAVISRFPIDTGGARDFTNMAWTDLADNLALPETPIRQKLSTTAHWDVPITMPGGRRLHLLVWHATPPVFDGPEDRNGRRNHDETALWLAYLNGKLDKAPPKDFVLAGVANLDPVDGDGRPEALLALMGHGKVTDPLQASDFAPLAAKRDGGVNAAQRGDPALDTADWGDEVGRPGNLRVDYVLPSRTLSIADAGVFWPAPDTSLGGDVERASRHRLVWVDVMLPKGGGDGG